MACSSANDWNHPSFVDGDEDECVDGCEDGHRAWGDFEVGPEVAVGFDGLTDEEG